MEEIGELIHVKIADEQIVFEAKIVRAENAREFGFPIACECLQSNYQQ